jgi:hypothetical protein
MDEVLEVLEVAEVFGLDGVVSWLFRIVGFLVVLAGLGLWLFTDMGLLVLPAAMIVVGVLLMIGGEVLVELADVV